jgi:shikimate dehydrogenase
VPVVTRPALWLLGQGIEYSVSPAMQNAALRACGLDEWEYAIRDVTADGLPGALDALRRGEAAGANVTIPHKRAVAAACDELQGDALRTGAVNTVLVRDGRLIGENTDARGLELALRHDGLWPEPGASVVVLGAGGAAVAALLALSRAQPAALQVAARREEEAARVAAGLGADSVAWRHDAVLAALGGGACLLLNATPAPLQALPVAVDALPGGCTVVDLRYRPRPVDLVAAARARGLRAGDGLEMLLQQGMLSFALWTGMQPPIDVARAALHEAAGR